MEQACRLRVAWPGKGTAQGPSATAAGGGGAGFLGSWWPYLRQAGALGQWASGVQVAFSALGFKAPEARRLLAWGLGGRSLLAVAPREGIVGHSPLNQEPPNR